MCDAPSGPDNKGNHSDWRQTSPVPDCPSHSPLAVGAGSGSSGAAGRSQVRPVTEMWTDRLLDSEAVEAREKILRYTKVVAAKTKTTS